MPSSPLLRAPCIHARLHRLATKPYETSGLMRGLSALLFAVAWPHLPYDYLFRKSLETRGPIENLAVQAQGVAWLIGQIFKGNVNPGTEATRGKQP